MQKLKQLMSHMLAQVSCLTLNVSQGSKFTAAVLLLCEGHFVCVCTCAREKQEGGGSSPAPTETLGGETSSSTISEIETKEDSEVRDPKDSGESVTRTAGLCHEGRAIDVTLTDLVQGAPDSQVNGGAVAAVTSRS